MAYGEALKTTTISVKLTDEDLAVLDMLVEDKEFCEGGMPAGNQGRGWWFTPKRSHALRAALRAAAPGKTKAAGHRGGKK
jgi:hypothetical protein